MIIRRRAMAGSLESSDCLIELAPSHEQAIQIASPVLARFGEEIRRLAKATLAAQGLQAYQLRIQDQGALPCTLEARLLACIERACAKEAEVQA